MDVLREILLPKLEGIRKSGDSYMARCPAHDDSRASLSVSEGKEHPVVINCHAGCDRDLILDKLGLTWTDLCAPREDRAPAGEWTPCGVAVAIYDYRDEAGNLLFQVCRTANKDFPQRIPDSTRKSGYRWSLGDTRRVPYRLPRVIEAVADGETIWIAEGEKDVHALERAGLTATCNPSGAGNWKPEYAEFFKDALVTIVADKDEPGQKHARQVAASLEDVAAAVEIVEAAGAHKDAAAHLGAGLGIAEFVVTWQSGEEPPVDLAPDLYEFLDVVDPPSDWVIPHLLERGDRLLFTGFEGQGKSVLIRQLAICAAAGVHPFDDEPTAPQRVLFIDLENPDRKSRRHFRKLEEIARGKGFPVPEGAFRIIQKPAGIDLTRDDDAAWLMERVTAHKPDLLVIGPFYRLHAADMNEEKSARKVVSVLDAVRVKADCALITEAHAGHGAGTDRSVRPTGSSLLLRWPEFGYGLKPATDQADEHGHFRVMAVKAWRGPREERAWPAEVMWGTHDHDWPWIPATALRTPQLKAVQ